MSLNDPIGSQTPPPLPWELPPAMPHATPQVVPQGMLGQTPSTNEHGMGGGQHKLGWVGGGPRRTPIWLWVVTLGLLLVLVFFQRPEGEDPKRAEQQAKGMGVIKPPKVSEFVLVGKFMIAIKTLMSARGGGGGAGGMAGEDPTAALVQMTDQFAGWTGKNKFAPASASNLPKEPKRGHFREGAADRLRATIIAGESLGRDEIAWRVRDVEKSLAPESPLVEDVKVVRILYGVPKPADMKYETSELSEAPLKKAVDVVAERPDPSAQVDTEGTAVAQVEGHEAAATLTDEQKQGFRARHGWFAELALSRGDAASTLRDAASRQGWTIICVLGALGVLVFCAGIMGVVLLVLLVTRMISGKWRWAMVRPRVENEWPADAALTEHDQHAVALATPGSVWLETVAVFLASFLGIKLIGMAMHAGHVSEDRLVAFSLGAQWVIALSIFWPLARGMAWARWKSEIGWRTPRGVLREMGAGLVGYMAGMPVYFAMAVVVVVLTLIINAITGGEAKPQGNRILDLVEGGGIWELIVIYLLATVWAPVVEESIFRGCLFRHLRRRAGVVLAALGSALVFAALHGYVIQGLIMVGTLGFWFAMMREWRGSIVASMTAHAVHNGVVMAVMLIVLSIASA